MDFKDLIKTTEGLVVLLGLFLVVTLGKFWAFATAGAYLLLNVQGLVGKLKAWFSKAKTWF
jgi:hypothetical protein